MAITGMEWSETDGVVTVTVYTDTSSGAMCFYTNDAGQKVTQNIPVSYTAEVPASDVKDLTFDATAVQLKAAAIAQNKDLK